jgi:tRNA G18 (ribose-2'-O)-methylase SpoU
MSQHKQLSGSDLHQRQIKQKNINAPVIICDGLQTPENLGSILRVADATGSKCVILLDSQLDLNNKKITKLSRNTDKSVSIQKFSLQQFTDIRSQFKKLYALEITNQSQNLFESKILSCDSIMLGHESRGIRQESLELCDGAIHLPMYGVNGSMNISHALSVFIYEWHRQKSLAV